MQVQSQVDSKGYLKIGKSLFLEARKSKAKLLQKVYLKIG